MKSTVGFLMFLIGASAMDTQGNWWYVAAGITLLGLLITFKEGNENVL